MNNEVSPVPTSASPSLSAPATPPATSCHAVRSCWSSSFRWATCSSYCSLKASSCNKTLTILQTVSSKYLTVCPHYIVPGYMNVIVSGDTHALMGRMHASMHTHTHTPRYQNIRRDKTENCKQWHSHWYMECENFACLRKDRTNARIRLVHVS